MTITSEHLLLFPFWRDLKKYHIKSLRRDLVAALSVALMALPQAMAYAFAADLPPSAGIFAAIFGTIFTAAFGCSPILISGPTNTVAILIQSGTSDILSNFYPSLSGAVKDAAALQIVLQISLLIGLFQIFGGVLRMGRLTQFASRSVVLGYLTGAAIAIFVTQLFYFFGIPEPLETLPLYQQAWYLITHITRLHPPTAFLGLACLALLVFFQRLSEKIPGAILVIIFSSLFVYLLNLSPSSKPGMFHLKPTDKLEKVALLEEFGEVNIEFSTIQVPHLDLRILLKAVPLALAITLLSALEVTSIGRLYAGTSQQYYSDNQEIFGLGVSNFFSAFLGAMPSSGSFSRTALNTSLRAVTRFAAIFSGFFLFIIVAVSGFLAAKIPLTALSALMLLTAYSMLYFDQLTVFFRSTIIDRVVITVTVFAALLFPLDVAFYIGIATSIALHLKKTGAPDLVEYGFNNVGKLRSIEGADARPDPRISIVQPEGELFFASAEPLLIKLRELAEDESVQVIILQIINARYIDGSVCWALLQVEAFLKKKGILLLFSGVSPAVDKVFQSSGLKKKLGEARFFGANEQVPSEPTRKAYAFAKSLLT